MHATTIPRTKLLKESIDSGKGDELINSAIKELDRKLH